MDDRLEDAARNLVAISRWIDHSPGYATSSTETVLWRRVTKVASESGEAIDALAGMVGENPRKGVTHTRADVIRELLDVAVAALGAVEHLTGNRGQSPQRLVGHLAGLVRRAGIEHPAVSK